MDRSLSLASLFRKRDTPGQACIVVSARRIHHDPRVSSFDGIAHREGTDFPETLVQHPASAPRIEGPARCALNRVTEIVINRHQDAVLRDCKRRNPRQPLQGQCLAAASRSRATAFACLDGFENPLERRSEIAIAGSSPAHAHLHIEWVGDLECWNGTRGQTVGK